MKYDRIQEIRRLLIRSRKVSTADLCARFSVSLETIRRDLNMLESEGMIRKVYGGAVLTDNSDLPQSMSARDSRRVVCDQEKRRIAAKAIDMIPDNAIIALDSGTTIFRLAQLLSQRRGLTVLTNSMDIAAEVTRHTPHLVYYIGGVIKRTELGAFRNVRKTGLIAINLDEDDNLGWVHLTGGKDELLLATRHGMAIRFEETDVRVMGRTARGVRAINLGDEDEIVGMACVQEGATLLTVTENGLGRRTELSEYRLQSRGGKGILNYKSDKRGTFVADIKIVGEGDDIIAITDDGVIIRVPVAQITLQSRYGGGVKTMRIGEDSRVVAVACAPHEEDTSEGEEMPVEEEASTDEESGEEHE